MASPNEPGGGAVPSARTERRRALSDDSLGVVIYVAAIAVVSVFVVAIVFLAG